LGTRLIQKSVSNLRDKGPHSHPHDEDDGYTVARHPFGGRLPIYRTYNQHQQNHNYQYTPDIVQPSFIHEALMIDAGLACVFDVADSPTIFYTPDRLLWPSLYYANKRLSIEGYKVIQEYARY
jgi:hypothetical protein